MHCALKVSLLCLVKTKGKSGGKDLCRVGSRPHCGGGMETRIGGSLPVAKGRVVLKHVLDGLRTGRRAGMVDGQWEWVEGLQTGCLGQT